MSVKQSKMVMSAIKKINEIAVKTEPLEMKVKSMGRIIINLILHGLCFIYNKI